MLPVSLATGLTRHCAAGSSGNPGVLLVIAWSWHGTMCELLLLTAGLAG